MKTATPTVVLVIGLALLYPLQTWIDRRAPRAANSEDKLYLTSGETIKRMSLGLEGLVADIYWMRTVQYFGRKMLASGQPLSAGSTRNVRMESLAPLLSIIVTLDPEHIRAYRFGAIFLPERDLPAALNLLERGVNENPKEWTLYQDLGYIYWQSGDYEKAAQWYERGGQIEGAAWWMRDLAGIMRIKGGSRETARAIYSGYLTSDDPNIHSQAVARLKQLQSLDEMEAISALLGHYKQQTGSCPASLRVLAARLRSMGIRLNEESIPVDPDGFPYSLDASTCQAALAVESTVPR